MIFLIVATLAVFSACWYCGAVIFLYMGFQRLKEGGGPACETFSVVIAARNEEKLIGRCLESVLLQSIPSGRFEVTVVDDRSSDATAEIVEGFMRRHANLKLIRITETPPGVSPKKWAVSRGVECSRNDIVVFTDADCVVPPTWLDAIDCNFTPDVGLVQGITSYMWPQEGMNRLFFRLQSLDFLSHVIVGASAIGGNLPINSNANNFAFRREAFMEAGGYAMGTEKIVSGDDDLLLQSIWRQGRRKLVFMTDEKGAVLTMPTLTLGALFGQRARWGSKTIHYRPRQVMLLSGVFLFYCMIIVTFFAAALDSRLAMPAVVMLLVKYGAECLLMVPGLRRFGHYDLASLLPLASLLQLPLVICAVICGVFGRFTWKGQKFSRTVKRAGCPASGKER